MKYDEKYGNVLGKPKLTVGCSPTGDSGGNVLVGTMNTYSQYIYICSKV
jgi:hypothetical protein